MGVLRPNGARGIAAGHGASPDGDGFRDGDGDGGRWGEQSCRAGGMCREVVTA